MNLLDVPYFWQRDNEPGFQGVGDIQCNLTSQAMLLQYVQDKHNYKPSLKDTAKSLGIQPEEVYARELTALGYKTQDNYGHTVALRRFKLNTEFITRATFNDVKNIIDKGYPVPTGVEYKSWGHWVVIIGYNSHGFVVHDPYGSRAAHHDYYLDRSAKAGKADFYRYGTMRKIWGATESSGWIRVPKSFSGKTLF